MIKARVYACMNHPRPEGLNTFQRVLVLLIIASVTLAVLSSEPVVREAVGRHLAWLELGFGAIFLVEYMARVWSVGSQPGFSGVAGRLRYMRQPMAVIDLLAVLPFLAGISGAETMVLRLLRLLRLVALTKLARYSSAIRLVTESCISRRFELAFTVMLAGLIILVSSAALYVVEGDHQPEAFGSIPRAAWWSVATLTTVGYGDLVPVTPLGRFFAALTAFAGIGLIAMPTGILAAAFSEAFARARARGEDREGKA
ncbi:ion transporter [Luteimonas sp. SJ-92]|uniref:Ion transporter n=1 Tax=Luteimonas salinisoli TaxID=2752307 RepID=A0A853J8M9_9GAMM|nr:ion transporter [Luteimonas salinisoli]NZA25501.1 ion transporter [Luteimonas salinisoli]